MSGPSVKHSSETNEQYTPERIVELAREVMGGIDLDPASSELANARVRAARIFTEADGERALEEPWEGKIWLNPPGGQTPVAKVAGLRSNPSIFWAKLMLEWEYEEAAECALVLGFTMEVLQSSQRISPTMAEFPFCIPRQRIAFDIPKDEKVRQLQERADKFRGVLSSGKLNSKESLKKTRELGRLEDKILELIESKEEIVSGEQPPHGNVIVLVPPRAERHRGFDENGDPWQAWGGPMTRRFQALFSELGHVRV